MTRGSYTPLIPPLEDPESSLHKKTDKSVGEANAPKKSPFKDLKSNFGNKKGKSVGESSSQKKDERKIESFEQDPNPEDSDYETEPKFELENS